MNLLFSEKIWNCFSGFKKKLLSCILFSPRWIKLFLVRPGVEIFSNNLLKIQIYLWEFNWKRAFRLVKLGLACLVIVLFVTVFPSPYTFYPEEKPYYGDFSFNSLNPIRLTQGNFMQEGRGGVENYIPKLRLQEYTVQNGDTLWSISRKFDVDPDSIISCNAFSNVHRIYKGDKILVPNIRGIFVNVEQGDTIFKYASRYRLPTDFIMEINDLRTNQLSPGMKIFLPGVRYSNIERAYALGEAFDKPVNGRLTSRFGYRRDPFTGFRSYHTGIDIACRYGTPVHAAKEGKVVYAGLRFGLGRTVVLEHEFGYRTLYGHLSSFKVEKGDRVRKGEIIGFSGSSGRSTGPHLHFEVWHRGRIIDPLTQTNMAVR